MASTSQPAKSLVAVGLFSGIAGIELGLHRAGHQTALLSELEPRAQLVLKQHFPECSLNDDVTKLKSIPACDIVAAGFPCQDLSQCGLTKGIQGDQSSLIGEVFRLLRSAQKKPDWVLLENVPFMLQLRQGQAMRLITSELAGLGYRWAYRTIDARAFGLPQRRKRVILVASRSSNPSDVLFGDERHSFDEPITPSAFGFYWTEGIRGLGWGIECIPTLKGGSGLGIPSPPAIWFPSERRIATIDIRDAERLQGFPIDWTSPILTVDPRGRSRWKLIGNAVCVEVAAWVGKRLTTTAERKCISLGEFDINQSWPAAAEGDGNTVLEVDASPYPVKNEYTPLSSFLRFPCSPLSQRATKGFLLRARDSNLRFAPQFLTDVEYHLASGERTVSV